MHEPSPVKTRRVSRDSCGGCQSNACSSSGGSISFAIDLNKSCSLCGKSGVAGKYIHQVQFFDVDSKVRHCAYDLGDRDLIEKVSEGDLIGLEFC